MSTHHIYLRPKFADTAEWELPGEHDPLFFYVTIDNDIVTFSTVEKFDLKVNEEICCNPSRCRVPSHLTPTTQEPRTDS